ncbi:MAG: response regulator transcription factor [Candidatus Tritonobacter lacicola]|nr:response regulator transcription factor [Candidatus Tritonobacter lacicola]
MSRAVIVDDNHFFCEAFRRYAEKAFPALSVATFEDAEEALAALDPSIDLLILDWEMPKIDGAEFLERAVEKGMPRKKILILSSHTSEELHQRFATGSCLGVLQKFECFQEKILDMILHETASGEGQTLP